MKLRILILLLIFFFAASCSEDELENESVLLENNINPNEIDKWIHENYTKPYGIAVYYKSDASSPYDNVYPPKKDKVIPTLKALKKLWISLFDDPKTGGENFIKTTRPLKMNLYGGENTGNGRLEIATPGSALTMHIYNVDSFKEKDSASVFKLLRISYHNYAKRLLEAKPMNKDKWKKITLHQFYDNWQGDYGEIYSPFYSPGYFFGFYSLLARKNMEDDFAETMSVLLTHSKQEMDSLIKLSKHNYGPGNPYFDYLAQHAHVSLINKHKFVDEYLKENWQIHLNRLQNLSLSKKYDYLK